MKKEKKTKKLKINFYRYEGDFHCQLSIKDNSQYILSNDINSRDLNGMFIAVCQMCYESYKESLGNGSAFEWAKNHQEAYELMKLFQKPK